MRDLPGSYHIWEAYKKSFFKIGGWETSSGFNSICAYPTKAMRHSKAPILARSKGGFCIRALSMACNNFVWGLTAEQTLRRNVMGKPFFQMAGALSQSIANDDSLTNIMYLLAEMAAWENRTGKTIPAGPLPLSTDTFACICIFSDLLCSPIEVLAVGKVSQLAAKNFLLIWNV